MKIASEKDPLIGMFFHTMKEHNAQCQGQVVESLWGGHYLVQFYEWLAGGPSTIKAVHISIMTENWVFYETDEHMRSAYEAQGP